jgi:phosphomannomutase/phosphoglucomutase
MTVKIKLFGTNGVRGVVNEFLSPDFVMKMGKSIGSVMNGNIAVATDTRTSNLMLKNALISGILSTGSSVTDTGVVPTPALQYHVKTGKYAGGVVITASHNPPQFNGVKAIAADGTESGKDEENSIEDSYYSEKFRKAAWNGVGSYTAYESCSSDYIRAIASKVDRDSIRKRKFNVVLDCSNGASCYTAPYLMEMLGVRVVTLNASPQGGFPGHESEPTPDNLKDLVRMVKTIGADMGIAHDGDADRTVFVDENGRYIPGELSLALTAREIVRKRKGGIVVVPVSTPSVVEEAAKGFGGKTIYTRVGSPVVARKMMETGAVIGGEENGGIINPEMQYCRDGGMTAAKMLEIVAGSGKLSELIDSLPKFYTVKLKVEIHGKQLDTVMADVKKKTSSEKVDETDGLKIFLEDGWVLVRASGTEPLIRIFAESMDENIAKKHADEYRKLVEEIAAH